LKKFTGSRQQGPQNQFQPNFERNDIIVFSLKNAYKNVDFATEKTTSNETISLLISPPKI
jgi:hypothetical protein